MLNEPLLVADVGGTNARFGIATRNDSGLQIEHQRKVPCNEFNSFEGALSSYYDTLNGARVSHACMAVAGPVIRDTSVLTNLDWKISASEVRRTFDLSEITIINDFAAVASAIPRLRSHEVSVISQGEDRPDAPIAVVGPGTGLGVAAISRVNDKWRAIPSEGGHARMPSCNETEAMVIRQIGGDAGVSAETLLSGRGICRIYNALCHFDGVPATLDTPEAVTSAAIAGTDSWAVSAIEMFCQFLATKSSDAVLTFGARGGLFLAGGILPAIEQFLTSGGFESRFRESDKMRHYLEAIKITLVTSTNAGLLGAASWIDGRKRPNGG